MTIEQEILALNKIVNSTLILSTYPDVDRIDVSLHGVRKPYLVYKIYMTNEDATKEDMYDDVDPFWLVDHHIMSVVSKLLPIKELPIKTHDYQIIVYNGRGIPIFDWENDLSQMKPGSTGRSDWEQRQNR